MTGGGKREGAGRPPIDPQRVKVPVGYKLPRWLVGWLRAQEEPAARLIEDALRRRHKLKPPAGGQLISGALAAEADWARANCSISELLAVAVPQETAAIEKALRRLAQTRANLNDQPNSTGELINV